MNQRLQQFISAENLTQSQFADTLGVARASVSHILAGRNKPGFDFIESMSIHFPSLNIEWLITGKGKMYKSQNETTLFSTAAASPDFAPALAASPTAPQTRFAAAAQAAAQTAAPAAPQTPLPAETSASPAESKKERPQAKAPTRSIEKVIVFYDDGSFQEIK